MECRLQGKDFPYQQQHACRAVKSIPFQIQVSLYSLLSDQNKGQTDQPFSSLLHLNILGKYLVALSNCNALQKMCGALKVYSTSPQSFDMSFMSADKQNQRCHGESFRRLQNARCCTADRRARNARARQVPHCAQTPTPRPAFGNQCFGVSRQGTLIFVS